MKPQSKSPKANERCCQSHSETSGGLFACCFKLPPQYYKTSHFVSRTFLLLSPDSSTQTTVHISISSPFSLSHEYLSSRKPKHFFFDTALLFSCQAVVLRGFQHLLKGLAGDVQRLSQPKL